MDYDAKIADLKAAIMIKVCNRQSTAVLLNRLSKVRTLQIKAEMRDQKKRAKAKVSA